MCLSIRNRIPGTVVQVVSGEVMAVVKVRLEGGRDVTAAITLEAVEELGIAAGSSVRVLAKSTEVSLVTSGVEGLSIRNQIPGTVTDVATGDAMASVKVDIAGGVLTAAITREAVEDLGLVAGATVVALIKSTEISLAL